jgi:hypothetical protein
MVRLSTVNWTPALTTNTPTLFPPLIVIRPPPSMMVSAAIILVPLPVLMSIVTPPPQLNVTNPPPARASFRTASVQLAAVPMPTMPAAWAVCSVASKSTAHAMLHTPNTRGNRPAADRFIVAPHAPYCTGSDPSAGAA